MPSFDPIIRYSLWFIIFIGIWFIIYPLIIPKIKTTRMTLHKKQEELKEKNEIYLYIENLLFSTLNINHHFGVLTFFFFSTTLGFLSLIVLLKNGFALSTATVLMVFISCLPFIFLYIRLHQMRISTSYEGELMVTELLNNYRILNRRIDLAFDLTAQNLSKYPNSQKIISQLAKGIKDYQGSEEILLNIVQTFHFQVQTSWGQLLSNLIYNSVLHGDDITEGLKDILEDLKSLDNLNEKNKQTNIEGELMLKLLVPSVYLGTLYLVFSFFQFPLQKYINYQFRNPLGFQTFFLSMLFFTMTVLVYLIFKKPKNDF